MDINYCWMQDKIQLLNQLFVMIHFEHRLSQVSQDAMLLAKLK